MDKEIMLQLVFVTFIFLMFCVTSWVLIKLNVENKIDTKKIDVNDKNDLV